MPLAEFLVLILVVSAWPAFLAEAAMRLLALFAEVHAWIRVVSVWPALLAEAAMWLSLVLFVPVGHRVRRRLLPVWPAQGLRAVPSCWVSRPAGLAGSCRSYPGPFWSFLFPLPAGSLAEKRSCSSRTWLGGLGGHKCCRHVRTGSRRRGYSCLR